MQVSIPFLKMRAKSTLFVYILGKGLEKSEKRKVGSEKLFDVLFAFRFSLFTEKGTPSV